MSFSHFIFHFIFYVYVIYTNYLWCNPHINISAYLHRTIETYVNILEHATEAMKVTLTIGKHKYMWVSKLINVISAVNMFRYLDGKYLFGISPKETLLNV